MKGLRCQVLLKLSWAWEVVDDGLETVVDRDVLDDEDNSENIHDLEMMDDHGKEVTVWGHESRVLALEKSDAK